MSTIYIMFSNFIFVFVFCFYLYNITPMNGVDFSCPYLKSVQHVLLIALDLLFWCMANQINATAELIGNVK